MKLKILGILTLGTLCSAAMLQPVAAQQKDGLHRQNRDVSGQHTPRQGPGREDPQARRGEEQRLVDTDGDGLISEAEFTEVRLAEIDEHFNRLDADGDGLISAAEQIPPARPERPTRPSRPERPEIDRDAVTACVQETIADFEPPMVPDREERFDFADTNADGFLSLAEISAAMSEKAASQFARIDTDADGFLSKEELMAQHAGQLNIRRVTQACIFEQSGQANIAKP